MDDNKEININKNTAKTDNMPEENKAQENKAQEKPAVQEKKEAPKDKKVPPKNKPQNKKKKKAGAKKPNQKSSKPSGTPKGKKTALRVVKKDNVKPSDKKSPNKKLIFLILAAAVLILLFIISRNTVIKIGEKQVMFSQEYTMNSKAAFHVCNDSIYYSSKDGMILLNKKGETVWTDTFTMTSPVMLCDGEYSAVADNKSKTVNVYNLTGKLYSVTAGGDITTFTVNPIGCCAVVCKTDDNYKIDVYSEAGEQMFEGSYAASDGMPLAVDISDDGKLLAVSLVNISEINMKSNVLFYYTTKTEAQNSESSDGMISAINCEEDMAGVVRFLPDSSCIIATDKKIMDIGGKNTDSYIQNWEIPYTNYITAMDIVDNKYIALAYGEPISAGTKAKPSNSVYWYNTRGKEIGSAVCDERITNISSAQEASIVYMGKNFKAFTVRGKELWSYTALQNVESIQFYDSQDTIVLATATKMNLLDVKKGAEMEEEISPDIADIVSEEESKETETKTTALETTAQTATAKGE